MVTGLIFIICVMAFRRGIVGELNAWWVRRRLQGCSHRGLTPSLSLSAEPAVNAGPWVPRLAPVEPAYRPNGGV